MRWKEEEFSRHSKKNPTWERWQASSDSRGRLRWPTAKNLWNLAWRIRNQNATLRAMGEVIIKIVSCWCRTSRYKPVQISIRSPSRHFPLNKTCCSSLKFSNSSSDEKLISRDTALHLRIFLGTRASCSTSGMDISSLSLQYGKRHAAARKQMSNEPKNSTRLNWGGRCCCFLGGGKRENMMVSSKAEPGRTAIKFFPHQRP